MSPKAFRISKVQWIRFVEEALESLPEEVRRGLEGVAVVVKARPGREARGIPGGRHLLGLYVGTPRTERSVFAPWSYPNTIYIYYKNIESVCQTPAEARRQVRITVFHEVGHYLGLSEADLQVLEAGTSACSGGEAPEPGGVG